MSELFTFSDGLTHYFDYKDYVSEAAEWANRSSGGSLAVTGGSIDNANKCVYLPQSTGYAYCPYDIGNNCTVYAVVKGDKPTGFSGTSWGIAVCGANSNYRVFCGQDTSDNSWQLWTPSKTDTNISASEWHVIAFSVANGVQKIYFDGELANTVSTVKDFALKGLYINNGGYNGAALSGTSAYSANMYIRGIALFNTNQTEGQIKENSEQLAVDFGLKLPEKNSRLAGTDAVAIAYAVARNQESAAALRQLKRAYQEGMVDGDGKTTIPYETTDPEPEVITDPENDDTHGETDDGTVVDINKGVWAAYTDDDGNPSAYVRVYADDYFWSRTLAGIYEYNKRRICVDIYSADGTLLFSGYNIFWINGGRTCFYMDDFSKSTSSLSTDRKTVIKISIRDKRVWLTFHGVSTDSDGNITNDSVSEITYNGNVCDSFDKLAGVNIGIYSYCTNVDPF